MATIYAAPAAVGSGNGSSSANAMSLTSAASQAVAGDLVLLVDGNYSGSFPTPANNGQSASPITFQAVNTNGPVFNNGTQLTGWSTVTLSNGDAGGNVYRANWNVAQVGPQIWANDYFQTASPYPTGSAGATGRNCALANMGYSGYNNASTVNPNLRIHTYGNPVATSSFGIAMYQSTFQFRINADGVGGAPTGTVDIRLNNDSPSNYTIWGASSGKWINWSGKNWITFKGLRIWRWTNFADLSGCTGIVFDTCDFRYAGNDHGILFNNGCASCSILNSNLVGCGSNLTSNADMVWIAKNSSNITVDNNVILHAGHDNVLIFSNPAGNPISGCKITNNEIGQCGAGINFTDPGTAVPTGFTIAGNYIHDCGPSLEQGWDSAGTRLHSGIECSSLVDSVIRHNKFKNCGYGMYLSCQGSKEVGRNKIYHNTFVDCERNCILLISDAYANGTNRMVHDNIFTNNIFYGPSGNTSAAHDAAVWANIWSGGNVNNVYTIDPNWSGNPWWGNRFDYNQFYAPSSGNLVHTNTGAWTSLASAIGGSMDGVSNGVLIQSHNQQGDPLFTNYATGDYTLGSGSPCIDHGIAVSYSGIQADPLSYNGTPDIGRYESGSAVAGPPTAKITTISPASGTRSGSPAVLTVSFVGTGTPVSPSTISSYSWNFGDGSTATGASVSHNFTTDNTFTVTLTVTDSAGKTGTDTGTVTVNPAGATNPITFASATASSYQQTPSVYPPGGAIDGKLYSDSPQVDTGRWISDPNTVPPQWWVGDMGATYAVTQLQLSSQKWESGRIYTYDVAFSLDNVTFTTAVTGAQSSTTGPDGWTTHNFASAINARYVKITQTAASDNSVHCGLWEVKAQGTVVTGGGGGGGGGTTATPYVPVTAYDQDGQSGPFGPAKLIDAKDNTSGDPFSRWFAGPGSKWVVVDLGTAKTVGRVDWRPYHAKSGRTYTYSVETSLDAAAWTAPSAPTGPTTNLTSTLAAVTSISFTAVSARYVRLTLVSNNQSAYQSAWIALVYPS